jgi:hypothetical protein
MQSIAVALIVFACMVYAVWTLMPAVLRRAVATRIVGWPWPGFIARKLQRAAQASGACGGCDSCDTKGPPKRDPSRPDVGQPIQFHRGSRR